MLRNVNEERMTQRAFSASLSALGIGHVGKRTNTGIVTHCVRLLTDFE
jgi:hypothetical protein